MCSKLVSIASDDSKAITVSFSFLIYWDEGCVEVQTEKYVCPVKGSASWAQRVPGSNPVSGTTAWRACPQQLEPRHNSLYKRLPYSSSQLLPSIERIFVQQAWSVTGVKYRFVIDHQCRQSLPGILHRFSWEQYQASHTTFPALQVCLSCKTRQWRSNSIRHSKLCSPQNLQIQHLAVALKSES